MSINHLPALYPSNRQRRVKGEALLTVERSGENFTIRDASHNPAD